MIDSHLDLPLKIKPRFPQQQVLVSGIVAGVAGCPRNMATMTHCGPKQLLFWKK
jgi:hypothetical protein